MWSLAIVLGVLAGRFSVLQPLQALQLQSLQVAQRLPNISKNQSEQIQSHPAFARVQTVAQLAQQLANTQGKPVLLDFYADWCISCIEFEQRTFSNPQVAQLMSQFVLLQVDVTRNTADDAALLKQMNLFGPPGLIFFNEKGIEIQGARVIGFLEAAPFLEHLQKILAIRSAK
jgi:thiol:disulfide interchange protein DsbD